MNLTECFNQEGKNIERSYPITKEVAGDVTLLSDSVVNILFSNIEKGKVLIEGEGELVVEELCNRCLSPVSIPINLSFTRTVYSPDISIDDDTKEEQYYLVGYELNIDALLKEVLLMEKPTKVLCKEDCKGICNKCGIDLNSGTCDCDDFVPDVRFAGLMDLLG